MVEGFDSGRDGDRDERLRVLRESIGRGEYRVDAEQVADAILAFYSR